MVKGVIYSNISKNHKVAIGYLKWYENQWRCYSVRMFSKQYSPELLLKINQKLEKSNFKFAGHVRKSHHVNCPVDVMMMKLTEFMRKIADEVIKEDLQPELPFTWEKENE